VLAVWRLERAPALPLPARLQSQLLGSHAGVPTGRWRGHGLLPVAGRRHVYGSGNDLAGVGLNVLYPRVMYPLPSIFSMLIAGLLLSGSCKKLLH